LPDYPKLEGSSRIPTRRSKRELGSSGIGQALPPPEREGRSKNRQGFNFLRNKSFFEDQRSYLIEKPGLTFSLAFGTDFAKIPPG
jgi:hypothetical protein